MTRDGWTQIGYELWEYRGGQPHDWRAMTPEERRSSDHFDAVGNGLMIAFAVGFTGLMIILVVLSTLGVI